MLAVVVCVAAPILAIGMLFFVRSQYGDEVFELDLPPQDLNRADDYRLIKMPLQGYNTQSDR